MPVVGTTCEELDRAAALLRDGGVVAIPTETVYGLAANALDARAVARIFEIKQRPAFDPLIVHVLDRAMLSRVALGLPPAAWDLAERFWPGPLTFVLSKTSEVPDLVTSGLATVAVRMPSHPVTRALLERAGTPLAAPSANPFGRLSPTRADHVARMLGERVDLIVDAGACEYGVESTIVAFTPEPTLLRHGAIAAEEVERVTGRLLRAGGTGEPVTPGMLPRHYVPRTPLRLTRAATVPYAERARAGFLGLARAVEGYACVRLLSERSDLGEAATRLFEALHDLDARGLDRIDAEPFPETGLGAAIMDRLRRAAARDA